MLARGANPNNRDTNGNTVLHMLVIYGKIVSCWKYYESFSRLVIIQQKCSKNSYFKGSFDMAYEVGADLNIKNVLQLTPLTLAAKLARVEMFFHILKIEREIYWQIGKR